MEDNTEAQVPAADDGQAPADAAADNAAATGEQATDTAAGAQQVQQPQDGAENQADGPPDGQPLVEQQQDGQNGPGPSICEGPGSMIMLAVLLVMMYLLFWRPQQKQAKQRKEMLSQIKKNDRVVTIGGIYGIVYSIVGDEVTLKIDERNDVRIKVSKGAISRVSGDEIAGGDSGSTIEAQ